MHTGLAGRAALISGGSRGIGRAIGAALAREGVNVALIARKERNVTAALASDRAAYITGAKIPIDGGLSVNSR